MGLIDRMKDENEVSTGTSLELPGNTLDITIRTFVCAPLQAAVTELFLKKSEKY